MTATSDDDGKRITNLYSLLKRRGFFWPSYEIYGGVAGFFDLGPQGSLLRENIESAWKRRFVVEEGFLLVDCPSITPEIAFKWSGHLEKFTDQMTTCGECSNSFRADHLLEGIVDNPDGLDQHGLEIELRNHGIKCPICGGTLGLPEEFNLMFKTVLGAGNTRPAYLRPETAQSIFMDFSLLYRMNRERMPFGVAQLGKGFRNEISPRQGMVRQREFHMAEGEFFYDPDEPDIPSFAETAGTVLTLVPKSSPNDSVTLSLEEACDKDMIQSKILAHFMAVTGRFAGDIGIPGKQMRFRQHQDSEMAHYARDCWDLEVNTSYGWVEMVGIADRSAYDLGQHSRGSGQQLTARRKFSEPRTVQRATITVDLKVLGPVFRGKAKEIAEIISEMDSGKVQELISSGDSMAVETPSGKMDVPVNAIGVNEEQITVTGEEYTPHVVEPSFGIDRLMVAVLEHAYFEAEKSPMKEQSVEGEGPYRVLRLLPAIAPIKCGVFPLMNKDGLPDIAHEIDRRLRGSGLTTYYDQSGSIGRRYARMDEIGTPFSITVDYESKDDKMVTIRDRDTGEQVRLEYDGIENVILDLVAGIKDIGSFRQAI